MLIWVTSLGQRNMKFSTLSVMNCLESENFHALVQSMLSKHWNVGLLKGSALSTTQVDEMVKDHFKVHH